MKSINVTFEDKEFKLLLKKKENKSWREFILELSKIEGADNNEKI